MKVILGVDGGRYSAWFTYTCPECGTQLEWDKAGRKHPTHEENDFLFFCLKGKPIKCSQAGKSFHTPVIELEVSEL